jgi:hypothetical protein
MQAQVTQLGATDPVTVRILNLLPAYT